MYQHLPTSIKATVPPMEFGDSHINAVCKVYFKDESFCRESNGDISLWKLYNLFTSANKSSYIDSFADRAVNASAFAIDLENTLELKSTNWFISSLL
jgi:hypothetical protein